MRRILFFALLMATSCAGGRWTAVEKQLICDGPQVMRVLSVDDPEDDAVLRDTCLDLPKSALRSDLYNILAANMIATVTDPSQDGVGIAGPQVGISRRIVAVQRFDKAGEPFEVYPNVRIIAKRGELVPGPEGCLSVPGRRGTVLRSRDIDIQYTSVQSLRDTVETVTGYTAVIFQHECDHLDGVIYTDHIWSEPSAWYKADCDSMTDPVDVFYVCSTDVVASYSADGQEVYNAQLDSTERSALEDEIAFVRANIFPDSLDFYSPYYHQATMNALFRPESDSYVEKACLEVFDAFDHYMDEWNGGRRFIIAGFSQGAMLTVELLRHLTDEQYSRLVAAYVIGLGLDDEDVAEPHIIPAEDALSQGVCVSFNTVADSTGIWPLVYNDAVTCINPVNWCTDSTPATFEFSSSSAGDVPATALTAAVDTVRHVLVVPGFEPETTPFWPQKCLHHYDLLFYAPFLRRNALDRAYHSTDAIN